MRKPMSVARQFALAFGFLLVLMAAFAALSWHELANTNAKAKSMYEDRVVPLALLSEITRVGLRDRVLIMDALRNQDPANVEKRRKEIRANRELAAKSWAQYRQGALTPSESDLVAKFDTAHKAYIDQGILAALERIEQRDFEGANQITSGAISKNAPAYTELLEQLVVVQRQVAQADYDTSAAAFEQFKRVMLGALVLAVGCGAFAGGFITRRLTRMLGAEPHEMAAIANDIADGKLGGRDRAAADHSMLHAMQRMRASLVTIVGEVRQGVDSVASASSQISLGNNDLSSRTEEQASSLQQTAASIEQISGTVEASADQARRAHALAASATTATADGTQAVGRVVETMNDIAGHSQRIAEIISVIDSIAFQTNILALNAAVEAARAGEQGRGFAVVASEVRTLAQRSAQAAREIKSLISSSVEEVEEGRQRVATAQASMDRIVSQVSGVAELIDGVLHSAREQASGIAQINQAIAVIDQSTQSNAALVEESAAAAESLKNQATQLAHAVSSFRLAA